MFYRIFLCSFIFVFLKTKNVLSEGTNITIFVDYAHQGNKADIDISKCTDIPPELEGKVTAVDTQGGCVRFYAGKLCSGEYIEILSRSPSHHYLGDWNFNDIPKSAGPCRNECELSVTGPKPSQEGVNVTIYNRAFYHGLMQTITVQDCTVIPRQFGYKVGSVNTTGSDNCFQLYNNVDCGFNRTTGQDSIELRKGTPYHDNIDRWHIWEVKAISHCSMKCEKDLKPKEWPVIEPASEQEVVVFDEPEYKGNMLRVPVVDKHCHSLVEYAGWEGAANSIKLSNNETCVELFPTHNCEENNLMVRLNGSVTDLKAWNFTAMTRSMRWCEETEGIVEGEPKALGRTSKSVSRWVTVLLVVGGLVLGTLLSLMIVRKYKNPDAGLFDIFKRNQNESPGYGIMRL